MDTNVPSTKKTDSQAPKATGEKLVLASLSAAVFGTLGYAAGHWLGAKGAINETYKTARHYGGAALGLFSGTVAFYGAMNSSHAQESRGETGTDAPPKTSAPVAQVLAESSVRDGVMRASAEPGIGR